jgi:hypothetical protein
VVERVRGLYTSVLQVASEVKRPLYINSASKPQGEIHLAATLPVLLHQTFKIKPKES